ncbi:MAG: 3-(methylthio)propionyl-CoA ligase [Vulcanimicrobiaceae bacterium]
MRGLMMDGPLLISSIVKHAARFYGEREVVSQTVEGPIHRYTYRDLAARAARLAHALRALGVTAGDRVGTLAWNGYRHLELYYAISGIGAVCHTLNPRLYRDQIAFIAKHAGDRYLFLDLSFVPLVEALAERLPDVRAFVIMTGRATMPATTLRDVLCYEDLLAAQPATIDWPSFDENTAAALCYTSGTTGDPKGALYSHRSTVLHAFSACIAETSRRVQSNRAHMPIVPMFHVNAWGFPYASPMMGSKLVFCGPRHDAASLYALMEREEVQTAAAVPTVWLALLAFLEATGSELTSLRALRVGGSAAPPSMIEAFERRGIEVIHGWGMTETSPVCTTGSLKPEHRESPDRLRYQLTAGRCLFGVDMRIVADDGTVQPDDGRSQGELHVRGPWIAAAYYGDPAGSSDVFTADGWFKTGDICSLDEHGYLSLHDRSKDLIKSGGEWISSIDLENAAVGHPEIAEAAAIAMPHPTYVERPLLVVVRKAGGTVDRAGVLAFLDGKIAKWWMPDDVAFVDALPHTATGKISKRELRSRLNVERAHP